MRIRRSRGIRALAVTATAGLLLGGVAVTTASAAPTAGLGSTSTPEPCSEPPHVDVDQSNPVSTTISVAFACQAEAELHRIITASVAGSEILKIDTRTAVSADATHATEITIPKAVVCITDGTTGDENCLPS